MPIGAIAAAAGSAGAAGAAGAGAGASGAGSVASMLGSGSKPGAAIGASIGALQLALSKRKEKKAESQAPGFEDPERRVSLEKARQQAKAIRSGADPLTAQSIREVEQQLSGTQSKIARSTGGNVGGTISGLLQAQRVAGQGTNRAIAASAPRLQFATSLANQVEQEISQRRLDLSQFNRQRSLAQSAQLRKEGIGNLLAGSALVSGQVGGNKQPSQPQNQLAAPAGQPAPISTDPGLPQAGGDLGVPIQNPGVTNQILG